MSAHARNGRWSHWALLAAAVQVATLVGGPAVVLARDASGAGRATTDRSTAVPTLAATSRAAPFRTILGSGRRVSSGVAAEASVGVETDVLVYGGTPAGVLAAVTAARGGVRVVLLEPTQHVGGMMSSGLGFTDVGDRRTHGGYTREVFDRFQSASGTAAGRYLLEPHVAEQVFLDLLREARVDLRLGERLVRPGGTTVEARRIRSIATEADHAFSAQVFIDATYEGDLLADAGVTFRVGREGRAETGESLAGVRPARRIFAVPDLVDLAHSTVAPGAVGAADARVQDSNFRLCLSTAANRLPFIAPDGYDPSAYAVVAAYLVDRATVTKAPADLDGVLTIRSIGHSKSDVNDGAGVSLALPGANWGWASASTEERAAIEATHEHWTQGLLYFLRGDPSVPASVRTELARYGWCADEFVDSDHFPRDLYIREARRLVGAYVLTQNDVLVDRWKPDAIAIGSYRIDAHDTSRWIGDDRSLFEEGWFARPPSSYQIPYRVLIPRRDEIRNLLVPVAASATHVAWASLRMEPQFLLMGEAAGQAAVLAIAGIGGGRTQPVVGTGAAIAVQDVSVPRLRADLEGHGSILRLPGRPIPIRPVRIGGT